jgi:type IV secretion system protein VirB4
MRRGNPGWFERGADGYFNFAGHVRPDIVLMGDGSLLIMAELRGYPFELAAASERNSAARVLNGIWRNIASDTITVHAHFVRHRGVPEQPKAAFSNSFAADLDRTYRERVLDGQLFSNTWLLTIIVSPSNPLGSSSRGRELNRLLSRLRSTSPELREDMIAAVEAVWIAIEQGLAEYGVRRLGLRERNGVYFSEIAEALRLVLYADPLPVPVVSGPLGHALYTQRVTFGHWLTRLLGLPAGCPRWAYEIELPGRSRFGAIFGFREYPPRTFPGILDAVLTMPFPVVMSQSFGFLTKAAGIAKLNLKAGQMKASGDKAFSQIDDLVVAQDRLMSGDFAMGVHHWSLAIYADTLPELENHSGLAQSRLADAGAVVVPETLGLEAAYFGQLPGCLDYRARPGAINSKNFAHLADFGGFPAGSQKGHWGPPMVRFKTTASTAFDYVPHVADVGMVAIFGVIGSGKSTLLTFLLAMFDQYLVDHEGSVVFFDKDQGGSLLVRAVGGKYTVIRVGEPTGWAPLRGLSDTSADRQFLVRWIKGLIQLDELGPLSAEDEPRLARAVAAIMRLPQHLRSLDGLRQFLSWRDLHGAGARLEPWCRGRPLGWAFDGEFDDSGCETGLNGFDLTEVLQYPEIVTPGAQYLLYRVRSIMDGRRVVVSLDEARAYLLNEQFREDTQTFLLTARKNNAAVILVTQEPQHLLDGAFGSTMVDQCLTKVYFRNPVADQDVYIGQLHLSEGEFAAIRERMLPGSRQCLFTRRDAGSVIVNFDLSAMLDYVAVLSGRATTVRYGDKLRQQSADWVSEFQRGYKEVVE